MRIGFTGLGPMGSHMAARLLAAGHELAVWNRTPGRDEALVAAGARRAASPAEAARDADAVFSMVANDAALAAVALGEDGIASGLAAGAVHVSCGTISLELARRLDAEHQARGQHLVSATVLGRPPAAEAGKLYVMVAGAEEARARIDGPLGAIGQRSFVVGDAPWQSNLVKLAANFMIFSTIEQLSELFALVEKAGIAPATLFDVLSNSFCSAPVHVNYGRMILERQFSPPGGAMALGAKDNDLILAASRELAAPLPLASLLRDRFTASFARGDGELDFAALSNRARDDAGLG